MMASAVATSAGFAAGVPAAVWADAAAGIDSSAAASTNVLIKSCVRVMVASIASSVRLRLALCRRATSSCDRGHIAHRLMKSFDETNPLEQVGEPLVGAKRIKPRIPLRVGHAWIV